MFEYTALVDAPVQRFTSIVTGPTEEDDPVAISVLVPAARVSVPTAEVPAMLDVIVPAAPERSERVELPAPSAQTVAPEVVDPAVSAAPSVVIRRAPRTYAAPAPSTARPSFLPALVAVVAACVTAMWWLRRDSHDR